MLDIDEYIAANKPGGTTVMIETREGSVESVIVRRCIFYNHLLRGIECNASSATGELPRIFVLEDCWFQVPDEVDYHPYAVYIAYGVKDAYIMRNYFRHHALSILIAGAQNVTIENNICEHVEDTYITIYSHPTGYEAKSVVIRGNILREPIISGRVGISVYGFPGKEIDSVIIEGNKIYDDIAGIVLSGGIRRAVIRNNVLLTTVYLGIDIKYQSNENVLIEGNILNDVAGIFVEGGKARIVNNIASYIMIYNRGGTNPKGCVAVILGNLGFSVAGSYTEYVPIGTGDAYDRPARWCSQWGRFYTTPCPDPMPLCVCGNKIRYIKIDVSGIDVANGEVITVKFVAYKHYINLDDADKVVLEKSFTTDGTYYLSDEEISTLEAGKEPTVALDVYAKTNQESTSASVYVTVGVD